MKDLKSNPKALSHLKRKLLIDNLVLELVYKREIKELSYKVTSNEIIINVNSIEHRFKLNTPVNLIRKYFSNLIINTLPVCNSSHSENSIKQAYLFN